MGKRKGYHIPGYNYCGPGTSYDGEGPQPINEIDKACKAHDADPEFDYYYFNAADERLLKQVRKYKNVDRISAGIIDQVFSTKKAIMPHKTRYNIESKREDLPSNSLYNEHRISSDPSKGNTVETTGMYGRRSKSKFGRKRSRPRPRRRVYKKSRKTSRKYSKTARKTTNIALAKALNPSRRWEAQNGYSIRLDSAEKSYWIDPHFVMIESGATARNAATDYSLTSLARLEAIVTNLFSTIPSSYDMFYRLRAFEQFKISNFSNTVMHVKVYKLTAKEVTVDPPLKAIDSSDFPAALFTGQSTTNLWSTNNGNFNCFAQSSKMVGPQEVLSEIPIWNIKVLGTIVLNANDTKTVTLKHKPRMFSEEMNKYQNLLKWGQRLLFRVDTDISKSTAAGDTGVNPIAGMNTKTYGWTPATLVIQQYWNCSMAKKMETERRNYILATPTGNNLNLYNTSVKIVGEPANTSGAAVDTVF